MIEINSWGKTNLAEAVKGGVSGEVMVKLRTGAWEGKSHEINMRNSIPDNGNNLWTCYIKQFEHLPLNPFFLLRLAIAIWFCRPDPPYMSLTASQMADEWLTVWMMFWPPDLVSVHSCEIWTRNINRRWWENKS